MKFCSKCGTELTEGATFCPGCGSAVEVNTNATSDVKPTPDTNAPVQATNVNQNGVDTETDKAAAILAYLGFLALISYYAMKPQTEFGKFHAKQGLNLFILEVIVDVAGSMIIVILNSVGIKFIGSALSLIINLIWILSLVGLIYAAQGKMEELPIIKNIKIIK